MSGPHNHLLLVGWSSEMNELALDCGMTVCGYFDGGPVQVAAGHYIGKDEAAADSYDTDSETPVILSPDGPGSRRRLARQYDLIGFRFTSLIHPEAHLAATARIGRGATICRQAIVSTDVVLGDFVRMNVGATVMHDSRVGDYCTLAPRALVLGRVVVGEGAYIGANATVLPGVRVGAGSVVGAGAVVVKDVDENTTVAGVPASLLAGAGR